MREEPRWLIALGAAIALALGAAAAVFRLEVLTAYPEPVGVDGYWYAVQVRSLLEDGHTYYPTLPAALWFLCPFGAALGPVVGGKVGAAVGVSALALTGFALGRVLARSTAAGVVAAALIATSPASIYLTTEFVKQGIALTLLAGFLAAVAAAHEHPTRGRIGLALVAGVAAALAHKLAFAVALAALGAVALARWRRRSGDRRRLIALVALAAIGLAFLVATRSRWIGMLTARPDFTLPAIRFPGGAALHFGHEAAAAALVALALVGLHVVRRRRGGAGPLSPVGWTLALLALIAAIPWLDVGDPDGIGFRLRISAHLALAPLAGLLLVEVARSRRRALPAAAAVAVGLLLVRPLAREDGVVRPNRSLVAAARRAAAALPAGAEIVTPDRQVAFLMTWQSRRPARTRPRDGALGPDTWRVVPGGWVDREAAAVLADLAARPPAGTASPLDTHPSQRGGFHAMPEATYQAMVGRLSPASRRRWQRWDESGALPRPPRSEYDWFFAEEKP